MNRPPSGAPTVPAIRWGVVVAWAAVAVGVGGLVIGTRATRHAAELRRATVDERAAAPAPPRLASTAVTWKDLPSAARGPNAGFESRLGDLVTKAPAVVAPESNPRRELPETLRRRAERRAFDGAPPTVPHTVDERSVSACLACHGEGLVIADRIAPKMSHPVQSNCTQCHVPGQKPMVEMADSPPFETVFQPLRSRPGERFLPWAPPAMPHSTFMRQECSSCHGALGPPGLRTTHPERRSCTQCHATGSALEQGLWAP